MMDQKEFVDLLKQRDREAADLLYRTYSEKMMQICLRYVSDRQVAQDLLHDGFIIIFTSIDSLRRPDKLESWMGMIMKNLALKYLNQCKAVPVVSLNAIEEKEEPADVFPTSDLPTYESLLSVIERLPAGYQTVFKLSVLEGLSHKEIGALLGITPHSSSSQLFRAKEMLRKLIARYRILIIAALLVLPLGIWLCVNRKPKSQAHRTVVVPDKPERRVKEDSIAHISSTLPKTLFVQSTLASDTCRYQAECKDSTLAIEEKADSIRNDKSVPSRRKEKQTSPLDLYEPKPKEMRWELAVTYQGGTGRTDRHTSVIPSDISSGQTEEIRVKEKVRHYVPVTVSLLLHKPIGKHGGIETGIAYTRLRSDFTTIQETRNERIQKIDYIGIPVKGTFDFWNYKKIYVYASAGVTLNLPVKAVLKESTLNDGGTVMTKEQRLTPSLQWSVGTGIGIRYQLTPSIGIYAEPNLHYYFPNGDGLRTIWHEYPLNVSLPIGLRFSW